MSERGTALKRSSVLLLFLIGLSLAAGVALAETVYVQAKSVKLRVGKTSLDAVVTDLKFGDALEVLRKDGTWLEVQTGTGTKGWIFAGKTTATKPVGSGDDDLARLGKSVRRGEAGNVTASAGARGLDKASEGYADRAGITPRDRDAVDRMAAYRMGDQEVEDFLKEGGLGEYAK